VLIAGGLIAADRANPQVNPQVNPNDGVPLLDNPIHWMINLTIKTSNPRQAIQDKQSKTSNPRQAIQDKQSTIGLIRQ
jgi:hypothetical protein